MASGPPSEKPFPPLLALAESWAKDLGRQATRAEVQGKQGSVQPCLVLQHGDKPLILVEEGKAVKLALIIQLGDEDRKKLALLDVNERLKARILLFQALVSSDRTAFTTDPPPRELKDIVDLRVIGVSQTFRIGEDDPSSINRFADAIQEVVTTGVRALQVLGVSMGKMGSGPSPPPKAPPKVMYG